MGSFSNSSLESWNAEEASHVEIIWQDGEYLKTPPAASLAGGEEEKEAKVGAQGAALRSQLGMELPDRMQMGDAGQGERHQGLRGMLSQVLVLQM